MTHASPCPRNRFGTIAKQMFFKPILHALLLLAVVVAGLAVPGVDARASSLGDAARPAPVPSSAAVASAEPVNALTPSPADELLAAHNRYRRDAGLPPLRWSDELANGASDWAGKLAREQRFEHSLHGRYDPPYGENLALSTGDPTPNGLVDLWGVEKAGYLPGVRFPDVAKNGDWVSVGHYTQMVWRNTKEVGCGIARGPVATILVCRYAPAGNWIGELPY